MTVVVSDTSVLRALWFLNLLHLLECYFTHVLIPPAVDHELRHPARRRFAVDPSRLRNVRVRQPTHQSLVQQFTDLHLDIGESEALALAIEVKADAILIDEAAGRAAAAREGLAHIGVLGVLVRARREGRVDDLRPLLDRLRSDLGFFIDQRLYQRILKESGEQV